MKGFFVILAVALLCSCGSARREAERLSVEPFCAQVELVWREKSYSGELIKGQGSLELTLSGENLPVPVSYSIADGGYQVKQGDLLHSIPYEQAPPEAAAVLIYEAFAALPAAEVSREGEDIICTLPTAQLTLSGSDGSPALLLLRDGRLIFNEVSFAG